MHKLKTVAYGGFTKFITNKNIRSYSLRIWATNIWYKIPKPCHLAIYGIRQSELLNIFIYLKNWKHPSEEVLYNLLTFFWHFSIYFYAEAKMQHYCQNKPITRLNRAKIWQWLDRQQKLKNKKISEEIMQVLVMLSI